MNGWSSSDITMLAHQLLFYFIIIFLPTDISKKTDVRLLVFLVLWVYSQDDIVSAISFHIDLSF